MKDLTNQRFNHLVAQWPVGVGSCRSVYWLCSCDCGASRVVRGTYLSNGHTQSCGCLTAENNLKHGEAVGGVLTPEYNRWNSMIQRCTNPNLKAWKDYGGRGIQVCDRWRIFENFLADMGRVPEGKTLDRYPDNDGNYEPGNVRWATPKEQANNRRERVA